MRKKIKMYIFTQTDWLYVCVCMCMCVFGGEIQSFFFKIHIQFKKVQRCQLSFSLWYSSSSSSRMMMMIIAFSFWQSFIIMIIIIIFLYSFSINWNRNAKREKESINRWGFNLHIRFHKRSFDRPNTEQSVK